MKAITCSRYGSPDVLSLCEVATPAVGDDEVLIRVHATTVASADWRVRSMTVPRGFGLLARLALGVRGPRARILGTELAGVVEAVGARVTRFVPGERVLAFPGAAMQCHAEYRVLSQHGAILPMPAGLSFAEAASIPFAFHTALGFLRDKGRLQAGERLLVHGASGAVGSAAVQLARHLGAEVTAVCSGANRELVTSLGAHHVIDYTHEDFRSRSERWDAILDTVGTVSWANSRHALTDRGRLLLVAADLPQILHGIALRLTSRQRVLAGPVAEEGAADDLRELMPLFEAGTLRAVVDRTYVFEEFTEAHRYVDTGRKRGAVVLELIAAA